MYLALREMPDAQERGIELESLFFRAAKMTIALVNSSYTIQTVSGRRQQIDGFIQLNSDRYRLECKWEQDKIGAPAIDQFRARLRTAGVGGLFVSMSGFTSDAAHAAKEYAMEKPILLIEGPEIEQVFLGSWNLDELIRIKRTYFDQYGQPFHTLKDRIRTLRG